MSGLLSLCLSALTLGAAESTGPSSQLEAPKQICEKLMDALSKGRASEAAGLVTKTWCKPEEAEAVGARLENEYQGTEVRIGPDAGKRLGTYEYLGLRRWGNGAAKFLYLQKYEYAALVWDFALYNGAEGWKLVGISMGPETQEDTAALAADAPAADYGPQRQVVERFLAPLSAGLGNEAFAELKKSPWANPEPAGFVLTKLENQYRSGSAKLKQDIGNRLPGGGCEWVATKPLGKSIVNLFYNEKRERGFLMWEFTFYKGQDEWKLEAVTFGTDISPEQRAAAAVCEPAR